MNTTKADRPYTVNDARIGNIIRAARTNLGMTQEQLADAVDITPAFIGHIERGDKSLSLTTLVGIANTLKIPMQQFFAEEEPTVDEQTLNDFSQLVEGRSQRTKEAVLALVRTALEHLR